ncbi:MAG TPA: acetate--CoA ligase family protein, partial [Steroidobacteraceae bacterium]|nr:acetate--CoA ligase family protein [Steroidobacteraceae bacterium]
MPDLSALLSPRSIAVVGAAPDVSILRGRTLKVLLRHPYIGKIYPVSRSHREVQGLAAYASVDQIPAPVDLAVLIIPADQVPQELERCGSAGVRAAVILTSGFAEQRGDQGMPLQRRLREIAARYDMAVCGPNAEGFVNAAANLCATFSPAVDNMEIPLLPAWRRSGHVAVVAQSGGMGFAFFDRGRPKELPFSYIVTTGNEACLAAFDVVDYLLDEGRSEVFLMFLEDIKHADSFRRAADKALRAGKPIIVAKVGGSAAGRRAAASHTGALAGQHEIYRAMFRQYGIIEADTLDQMVDIAAAFSFYRTRLPAGKRVGIGTGSGGGGGWMADACAAEGLEVPELDRPTRALIDPHLPAYGTSQNPVDGTAQAIRAIGYGELARLIALSDQVDAVAMVITARNPEALEREKAHLQSISESGHKPILMWTYTLPAAASVRILSETGYPLFTDMRHCAGALAALCAYRTLRERYLCARDTSTAYDRARAARIRQRLVQPVLCEYQVAPLLADYGIPTMESQLASSAAEAARCAVSLGAPVALKVQSPDITHKTDAGAVALRVWGDEAVQRHYDEILQHARRHSPAARIDGVLVQRMAGAGLEVIVGVRRDPLFGPMMMLGMGGVGVEIEHDLALAPA